MPRNSVPTGEDCAQVWQTVKIYDVTKGKYKISMITQDMRISRELLYKKYQK